MTRLRKIKLAICSKAYLLLEDKTLNSYISLLGLPEQVATNWVAYNNQNVLSQISGGQKSEIKQGHPPSENFRGGSSLASLYLGHSPEILTFLGLKMHHSNFCLYSSLGILPVCLCLRSLF